MEFVLENKVKKVKDFLQELVNLPELDASNNLSENENYLTHVDSFEPSYIPTDNNFEASIEYLADKAVRADGAIKVAMLVGTSFYLSMLPELARHVDVVIMADIDLNVLGYNKSLLEMLKISKDVSDFERIFSSNSNFLIRNQKKIVRNAKMINGEIVLEKETANPGLMHSMLNVEKNRLKNKRHFLESEKRFSLCKNFLEKLKKLSQVH